MALFYRFKRFLTLGLCMAGWALTVCAQEEVERPAASAMTLKQCVVLALQQTFDLKIQEASRDIAAARVGAAKAEYEPTLTATMEYRDTTDPGGTDVQTGDFVSSKTQTVRGDTGITGLLPSGGRYTIGASATDTDGERGPDPFSNGSIQGPYAEFRQPLLENFRIDDTRLNIRVSLQNLQISTLELKQSMLRIVNQVEEAYYGLVAAEESVRVQEMALSLADELWRENQKRVEHGDMAPIEAAEAQSQASTTKAALLLAERQFRAQQNVLKGVMVDDFAKWRNVMIVSEGTLTTEPISFDYRQSWGRAMTSRPDLLTYKVQLEQQELMQERRKNALLPELDLTAGVGLAGSDTEVSGAFQQVRDQDAPYFSLGFSLSLPLGNRREKANHKIAVAETRQAELRLRQFRQSVMIEIDDAVSQAKTDYERITATREAREFAELALKNEQGKLNRGASTNFVVLQLQRNLTSARSDEIQSLADYSRSLSRLRLAEGSSLDTHQVDLTAE
ncbi:MAG: TolC family protein [Verrucomicrobiae bacterium]|nr:TolC family protein [Verrucomicrobiae bacterium]